VGAVESDYIAQVFDTGRDRESGAPYIAMEYLEGEDVQALIERLGPLPVDLSLRIALQACLGLERAHAAGVIHRDIKPANLFLARKEQGARVVKLLDFGVAKVTAGPEDHGLTKTGAMLGSPLYMSPEQARGSGVIDGRSDLWSLGITLFQCIAGRRPNDGVQGLGELLILICSTPAPWLQTVAPWASAEVAQVVQRALTIDPAARFGSATELADALRALLPYGNAIVDPMLVPLGATTRSFTAPQPPPPPPLAVSAAVSAITLGTIYNLGECLAHEGKTASAWAAFHEAASLAKGANQAEREAKANRAVAGLEAKLERMVISVTAPPSGLVVKRDGITIDAAGWGSALPVDPGKHQIEASAPGKKPSSIEVSTTGPGKPVKVEIPTLADAPPEPTPIVAAPLPVAPAVDSGANRRIAAYVTGGVGVAGIVVGAVMGSMAKSKWNEAQTEHCRTSTLCDAAGVDLVSGAKTGATVATVGFIAGGALLATGVVLFVTALPKSQVTTGRLVISPVLDPTQGGLLLRGSF